MVGCAPLWLSVYVLISLLVVVFDGRPIHYTERRVGRGGREFRCVKFRSMRRDPRTGAGPAGADGASRFVKPREDPHRTRFGTALRRSSFDELPQLLNVLAGHMSLVGPRPVTRPEVSYFYGLGAAELLSVRPGMTGLWQVSGRSLLPAQSRVRLDMEYVREHNLWLDLRILARTIPSVLRGHGAF